MAEPEPSNKPQHQPKFTDGERDHYIDVLLHGARDDFAGRLKLMAETLALRAAVFKLAECSPNLDRDPKAFMEWIDELEKHFHQDLLTKMGEQFGPTFAAMMDQRKLSDL
jgi:hypothetical protein